MNGLHCVRLGNAYCYSLHSLVHGDDLDVAQLKGITEDDTANATCGGSQGEICANLGRTHRTR